jgi:hypothetical protein
MATKKKVKPACSKAGKMAKSKSETIRSMSMGKLGSKHCKTKKK